MLILLLLFLPSASNWMNITIITITITITVIVKYSTFQTSSCCSLINRKRMDGRRSDQENTNHPKTVSAYLQTEIQIQRLDGWRIGGVNIKHPPSWSCMVGMFDPQQGGRGFPIEYGNIRTNSGWGRQKNWNPTVTPFYYTLFSNLHLSEAWHLPSHLQAPHALNGSTMA